jgi:hypothetical protein
VRVTLIIIISNRHWARRENPVEMSRSSSKQQQQNNESFRPTQPGGRAD